MSIFDKASALASSKTPFLIISDFKALHVKLYKLDELKSVEYVYDDNFEVKAHNIALHVEPVAFKEYKAKFDEIIENIKCGNTYLTNLTQSSKVSTCSSVKEIYESANAPYKLHFRDETEEFVSFSPEKFVEIVGNKIYTYPMKGTINASIPNASELILADEKERAEHVMVVDLLRNDLGRVATGVHVEDFRYIQKIRAGDKELLHVSSKISATLDENWQSSFGDIFKNLLPAGSISGTPKHKTLQIIDEVEGYERGFFSGVWGVFDGENFKSAVMIRFIEKSEDGLIYKSGGGITLDSDALSEYEEMIAKVYVP